MHPTRRQLMQLGLGGLVLLSWPRFVRADNARACHLSPVQTAGPFYLEDALLRQDITDGKPGTPLRLQFQALQLDGCLPLGDAALEIWHCDAQGAYSGVGSDSASRFLRGVQITDDDGHAEFRSILPGYYPGRTNHVHLKLHLGERDIHTGQLYFPEAAIRPAMARPPYAHPGQVWTPLEQDYVFRRQQGEQSIAELLEDGEGFVARLTLVVDTRANT
ncbi:intradiol ring-cleavage dioxygenase [Pseudomonas sp. TCU-HL1]|uniref:intradiol ring-cleavage dioxygenase n=1 Tax=Pseudomonas sp. TCU-HL1 TaxID=1856685 RepID=UPI00083CF3BA|nr:intradiol ring-cleavage dioxygenase [Pseudomonas sp. TCU-HL1]AOE83791.1 dioxygenase [Pseudomonas sp. TCU-HL1]